VLGVKEKLVQLVNNLTKRLKYPTNQIKCPTCWRKQISSELSQKYESCEKSLNNSNNSIKNSSNSKTSLRYSKECIDKFDENDTFKEKELNKPYKKKLFDLMGKEDSILIEDIDRPIMTKVPSSNLFNMKGSKVKNEEKNDKSTFNDSNYNKSVINKKPIEITSIESINMSKNRTDMSSFMLSTDQSTLKSRNGGLKNNLKSRVPDNNDSLLLPQKNNNKSVKIDSQDKNPKIMYVDDKLMKKNYESKKNVSTDYTTCNNESKMFKDSLASFNTCKGNFDISQVMEEDSIVSNGSKKTKSLGMIDKKQYFNKNK